MIKITNLPSWIIITGTGVLFSLILLSGGVGATEATCNLLGESDFCIDDVSIDTEGLEVGDTTVIEVTITNVGNETSNARIIQGLNHPEGQDYAKIEDVNNVKSGESVTVSSSAEIISTGYREII